MNKSSKSKKGAKKSAAKRASKKADGKAAGSAKRAGAPRRRGAEGRAAAAPATDELKVKITTEGPSPNIFRDLSASLLGHASLRESLTKTRSRLLSLETLEAEDKSGSSTRAPAQSNRFRATIYDYSNNRVLRAEGDLTNQRRLTVTELSQQPPPTSEEFDEAVSILAKDVGIGPSLRGKRVRPYRPMPPIISSTQPDGRNERTVSVGLIPTNGQGRHEIVGVNMIRQSVVRFERGAPDTARADPSICGQPDATQPTTTKGVPGQAWVTVTQGRTVLWKFLVVRPSASSGTNGSGVELRFVDYRGKRVLYRAHVPILNVKYKGDACGPYRDWQFEEGMIQANGADVAPGFRLCPTPAKTIFDTGSDTGNFLGTAIYVEGQEVVLVSEMQAGWYRYISMWRLHADGTIRPRFGFSAVTSSCVCNVHYHHVYWRLDFDIRTPGNNIVREFNNPCLPGICPSNWHNKDFEIMRPRDPARHRKWRVQNSVTGEAYEIIPGPEDGEAATFPDAPFGRGDLWFLRYRPTEIDDGSIATGPPFEAGLNDFINGESLKNQDVVVWYAGHVVHDVASEPPGEFGHICGPELKPVNW